MFIMNILVLSYMILVYNIMTNDFKLIFTYDIFLNWNFFTSTLSVPRKSKKRYLFLHKYLSFGRFLNNINYHYH